MLEYVDFSTRKNIIIIENKNKYIMEIKDIKEVFGENAFNNFQTIVEKIHKGEEILAKRLLDSITITVSKDVFSYTYKNNTIKEIEEEMESLEMSYTDIEDFTTYQVVKYEYFYRKGNIGLKSNKMISAVHSSYEEDTDVNTITKDKALKIFFSAILQI